MDDIAIRHHSHVHQNIHRWYVFLPGKQKKKGGGELTLWRMSDHIHMQSFSKHSIYTVDNQNYIISRGKIKNYTTYHLQTDQDYPRSLPHIQKLRTAHSGWDLCWISFKPPHMSLNQSTVNVPPPKKMCHHWKMLQFNSEINLAKSQDVCGDSTFKEFWINTVKILNIEEWRDWYVLINTQERAVTKWFTASVSHCNFISSVDDLV